jgi:hypothetical protein
LAQVPVPESDGGIDLDFFLIDKPITNRGGEEELSDLDVSRFDSNLIYGNCVVIGEPHPHDVGAYQKPFLAGFDSAHQADIEVRQYVAE